MQYFLKKKVTQKPVALVHIFPTSDHAAASETGLDSLWMPTA